MKRHDIIEELGVDGAKAGVEFEETNAELEPFDPERIFIKTKEVPMDTLIRRLKKGTINLAPAFQRKSVWTKDRKSQLIESLILRIPIPMFYVASNRKEEWDVVDGLQRITTICEFLFGTSEHQKISMMSEEERGHGFKLMGLEFWREQLEGKNFSELPELLSTRILESAFTFTVIEPGTPEAVRRNIFKRINTGGMPLSPQEIRHALYQGISSDLLRKLSENKLFNEAIGNPIDDSRMAAREIILRMLAFMIRSNRHYPQNGDMDTFVSDTMLIINRMPVMPDSKPYIDDKYGEILFLTKEGLIKAFEKSMKRAFQLFGKFAFRKSYFGRRRTPVNKSLFETWGTILARMPDERFKNILQNKSLFEKEYKAILDTPDFESAISRNSWKPKSVEYRFTALENLTTQYGGADND